MTGKAFYKDCTLHEVIGESDVMERLEQPVHGVAVGMMK